jgi:hypothetical protein
MQDSYSRIQQVFESNWERFITNLMIEGLKEKKEKAVSYLVVKKVIVLGKKLRELLRFKTAARKTTDYSIMENAPAFDEVDKREASEKDEDDIGIFYIFSISANRETESHLEEAWTTGEVKEKMVFLSEGEINNLADEARSGKTKTNEQIFDFMLRLEGRFNELDQKLERMIDEMRTLGKNNSFPSKTSNLYQTLT